MTDTTPEVAYRIGAAVLVIAMFGKTAVVRSSSFGDSAIYYILVDDVLTHTVTVDSSGSVPVISANADGKALRKVGLHEMARRLERRKESKAS